MIAFTLKPVGGTALYVIYAIVSYEENKGIRGDLSFKEICSGYHVFAGRDSLYFTQTLSDAHAFIAEQLAAFDAKRRRAEERREQALLEHPRGRLADLPPVDVKQTWGGPAFP